MKRWLRMLETKGVLNSLDLRLQEINESSIRNRVMLCVKARTLLFPTAVAVLLEASPSV